MVIKKINNIYFYAITSITIIFSIGLYNGNILPKKEIIEMTIVKSPFRITYKGPMIDLVEISKIAERIPFNDYQFNKTLDLNINSKSELRTEKISSHTFSSRLQGKSNDAETSSKSNDAETSSKSNDAETSSKIDSEIIDVSELPLDPDE